METLILNGSPRSGGDTAALLAELRGHLKGDVLEVFAYGGTIHACVDCRFCWTHPGCRIADGMQEVYRCLSSCDNVVLASPIFFSELSGPLLSVASRLQTAYAARRFRGEEPWPGVRRGVVLLAGAQAGTQHKALSTAHSVLRHMNALPIVATVLALDTDHLPAARDEDALAQARAAAELLNRLYEARGRAPQPVLPDDD